jgi:SulP family sulfate permease
MPVVRQEEGIWAGLRADFAARAVARTVATGLIMAMVNVLLTIALITLIFRGDLEELLSAGIGLALVGSAVVALVLAFGSSFMGMYAGTQDASAAIIGLSAASIAGALAGAGAFDTVLAMIVAVSLATGLVFLAMGYLGLGDIARFVPFPVIGGLLAGTGYLILRGSLGILRTESLPDAVSADAAGLLWPGVMLGALFFLASRRGWRSRAYPLFLVAAVAGFHVVVPLLEIDRVDALSRGWMLGSFPDGALWPGTIFGSLADADWSLIAGEAASLVTILLIVPMTLLLYISALEVEFKTDVDMNRELRATGWANVAAALVGGPPGYMYLADTVVTSRLVGMRRGPAVVAPVAMLAVVVVGGFVLELVPQFVVGGMLLFVGAEFLYEWLWASRRRMARSDYWLMVGILVVIATVGFLPGVAVGLVAAVALFVVRYSRIDVIKHALTGGDHQSNIERAVGDAEYLREKGEATLILELQGFIFFGTASSILSRIRAHLETGIRQFIVCDFRRVTGVDSSAVAIFERIAHLADDRGIVLILTGMKPEQSAQFRELVAGYPEVVVAQQDLDHGMAWCEDRLLEATELGAGLEGTLPKTLGDGLTQYLEQRTIPSGERLMRQGDPTPGIFLISSGRATVQLEGGDGESVRLRTLLSGTVLGEISLYRDEPCTATVVADTDCDVLHLSPERFEELCRREPAVAAELHLFVARTLAGRVSHANRSISALHD